MSRPMRARWSLERAHDLLADLDPRFLPFLAPIVPAPLMRGLLDEQPENMMRLNLNFSRDFLLNKLTENLEKHITALEQANAGWKNAAIKWHEKCLRDIRDIDLSRPVEVKGPERRKRNTKDQRHEFVFANLRPPLDFRSEYETAINMLANCTDKEIRLSTEEYQRYVLDQWDWSEEFEDSVRSYTGAI